MAGRRRHRTPIVTSSSAVSKATRPDPLPDPEPVAVSGPEAGPATAHGAGFFPGRPGTDGDLAPVGADTPLRPGTHPGPTGPPAEAVPDEAAPDEEDPDQEVPDEEVPDEAAPDEEWPPPVIAVPGNTALATIPWAPQRRVASCANSMLALFDSA